MDSRIKSASFHRPPRQDRYQVFQVRRDRCQRLIVKVIRGKGITRGKIKDWRKYKDLKYDSRYESFPQCTNPTRTWLSKSLEPRTAKNEPDTCRVVAIPSGRMKHSNFSSTFLEIDSLVSLVRFMKLSFFGFSALFVVASETLGGKLINALFYSEFVLFDLNRTVNEEIGREIIDVDKFALNVDHDVVINYKNSSKLEAKIRVETK